MKRLILTLLLLSPIQSHAQLATIDVGAIAQLAQQVSTLNEQVGVLKNQYNQLVSLYNNASGLTAHGAMLQNPVANFHSYLPQPFSNAASMLRGGGAFANLANTLRDQLQTHTADGLFSNTHFEYARKHYNDESDYLYGYMALADGAYDNITSRRGNLESLSSAIQTADTQKSILDLNARINAENTLILNDIAQLLALQLKAQLERENLDHNHAASLQRTPTGAQQVSLD